MSVPEPLETRDRSASVPSHWHRWISRLTLLGILAWATALTTQNFTEPFDDSHHGGNGAYYSIAARNYLQHSYWDTRLAIVMNPGPEAEGGFRYYVRHPPLVPLLISLSFRIFGQSEAAARLVPVTAYLGALLLFYLLLRGRAGRAPALLATGLLATIPMTAYFGSMPDVQGSVVLFFCMLTVLLFERWSSGGSRLWALGAALALTAGLLADWPAFYLAAVLPVWERLRRGRSWRKASLWFPVLALTVGIAYFAWVQWLTGDWAGIFTKAAASRSYGHIADWDLLGRVIGELVAKLQPYFPIPLVVAFAVASVALVLRRHWNGPPVTDLFLLLLAIGVGHVVLFIEGAWVHKYWSFYLAPPIALAIGSALASWATRGRRPARWAMALGVAGVLMVTGTLQTMRLFDRNRTHTAHEMATALREATRPGETVLTVERIPNFSVQVLYYLQRNVVGRLESVETLQAARREHPGARFLYMHAARAQELPEMARHLQPLLEPALSRPPWVVFRLPPLSKAPE